MSVQLEAATAICNGCGAALSLAHHGRARCLYCLNEQPLPAQLVTPLREIVSLSHQLDQAEADAKKWGGGSWLIVVLLIAILPGAGFMLWFGVASLDSFGREPLRAAMTAALTIGGTLPVIAIPLLWLRVTRMARTRVLAALAPSIPRIEGDQLISICPHCGAQHEPKGELTVVCRYCETEALLPLPMVDRRLAKQHQAVLAAKKRGEAEGDAARAAVIAWQKTVVPAILGFCALFGVVIVVFVVLAEMTGP